MPVGVDEPDVDLTDAVVGDGTSSVENSVAVALKTTVVVMVTNAVWLDSRLDRRLASWLDDRLVEIVVWLAVCVGGRPDP